MLKRRPGTELNHDNWNEEEEPEEKGEFRMASEQELKNRVIRTAKRRNPNPDKPVRIVAPSIPPHCLNSHSFQTNSAMSSVFGGFSGFSSSSSAATPTGSSSGTKAPASIFAFLSQDEKKTSDTSPSDKEYHQNLRALNQKVSDWIKQHVDKNPLIILTPIFEDYAKYLREIESKKGQPNETTTTVKQPPTETAAAASFKGFSFGSSTPVAATPSTASTTLFGGKTDSTLSNFSSAPKLSFGSTSGSIFPTTSPSESPNSTQPPLVATASTGFSFGGTKPFSFGVTGPVVSPAQETTEENEDDEPPKVEFTPVVEEDSVYSKRCKVFFKMEGNFQERGVGTLFVKPVKDTEKHQMIVRADTSLGNILVNVVLAKGLPVKKMGANNVMLVCIPNTDFEKPVSVLLKVKTAADADEMVEKLQDYSEE